MTKEERESKILKAEQMAEEIRVLLDSIVWEGQEGQEEHFDKLSKSERFTIGGIFNDACRLSQSLCQYHNWFIK